MTPWQIWCKTLGDKIHDNERIANVAAILRSIWVGLQIVTCLFIIAGVIRHW